MTELKTQIINREVIYPASLWQTLLYFISSGKRGKFYIVKAELARMFLAEPDARTAPMRRSIATPIVEVQHGQ